MQSEASIYTEYVISTLHRPYRHIGFALVHRMWAELLRRSDERGEQASVSEVQMGGQ